MILVTGANGFIGQNLCPMLNDEIIKIDNFRTSKPSDDIINLDLTNSDISKYVKESDLVIHLASSVGVKEIYKSKESFINSKLINDNVISACAKYNKKLIYLSTSEVYGDNEDCKETDILKLSSNFRSSYACEKLNTEFYIQSVLKNYLIIRPFNITGKGQSSNYGMVLPNFIEKAKINKPIHVYCSNGQIPYRSFCDVQDFCNLLIFAMSKHNNTILNIGNPFNYVSMMQLAQMVVNKTSSFSKVVYKNFDNIYKGFNDILHRRPNIDKLKSRYTFKSLTDIIMEMRDYE